MRRPTPDARRCTAPRTRDATDVIQVLADHGAKLDVRDYGNTDNRGGKLAVHTWQPVDYADGLVRVGVQSAIPHPETGLLLAEADDGAGTAGAADGPDARIDLHHRGVRYGAVTTLDLPIFDR